MKGFDCVLSYRGRTSFVPDQVLGYDIWGRALVVSWVDYDEAADRSRVYLLRLTVWVDDEVTPPPVEPAWSPPKKGPDWMKRLLDQAAVVRTTAPLQLPLWGPVEVLSHPSATVDV